MNDFGLTLPASANRPLAARWLLLALLSLVGSGVVVLLVILARTPVIHDLIPWVGSFKTALVIHVDLSVLVWFLSFAGLLSALTLSEQKPWLGKVALTLAGAGALVITLSPFLGEDLPYMNNYVPVLDNGPFFIGLALFGSGFLLMALYALLHGRPWPLFFSGEGAARFGVTSALVIAWLAAGSLLWTRWQMPAALERDEYWFELLFWGSGHIIQFTHAQLMMVVWLWLGALTARSLSPRLALFFLALGALPAFMGPLIHMAHDVDAPEHRAAFTWLMQYGGGLAALPLGIALLFAAWQERSNPPRLERTALLLSILLFGAGGAIGFMISGVNVTIPAHYHGSIVAITLAFMGLTYHLLPQLGYARPSEMWARRQLVLYGIGSLLHIWGLTWSGGHGVQRKTAGAEQGLVTFQDKLPMWIMGLGGILAVAGGILFLVLAFRALRRKSPEKAA